MASKRRFTVEILGDSKGVERATERSEKSLGRLSMAAKLGGSGLHLIGTGALAAGVGLAGLGVTAAKVGITTASGLEQANIGFTTMLGSAQKARDFLGQLQKFAAATPFEFPQLVSASQKLLAMGFAATDVLPTLTAIGDAVAGLGGGAEQIDQVTMAIGQMMAKDKVQGDELLQLTEVGIPALKILADAFHVSTERMSEMVTKGDVLSSKAIPLLVQGLEKGTKSTAGFGGMMEKQSHSLAGMWSTLKDTVSMALSNMVTPAIPAIESGLGKLTKIVGGSGKKVLAPLVKVTKDAAGLADVAIGAFTGRGSSNGLGAELPSEILVAARQIGLAMRTIVDTIKRAAAVVSPILAAVARIVAAQVVPVFRQLADAAHDKVLPALSLTAGFVRDNVLPVLSAVAGFITSKVLPAVIDFGGWLIKYRGWLLPIAAGVLAVVVALKVYSTTLAVVRAATAAWAVVQGALNTVLAANPIGVVVIALFAIGTALVLAWRRSETFRDTVKGAFHAVATAALAVRDVAVKAFAMFANALLSAVGFILKGAASAFGWIPGIGGKLKKASADFQRFKDDVNAQLNGINEHKVINLEIVERTTVKGSGTSGSGGTVRRLASGGPFVPGLAVVGEEGPELVEFSQPGRVIPAGPTRRILGAGANARNVGSAESGGGRTVIEIRSDGTRLGELLVGILREAIRVRGGDVQVVLGR